MMTVCCRTAYAFAAPLSSYELRTPIGLYRSTIITDGGSIRQTAAAVRKVGCSDMQSCAATGSARSQEAKANSLPFVATEVPKSMGACWYICFILYDGVERIQEELGIINPMLNRIKVDAQSLHITLGVMVLDTTARIEQMT